MKSLRWPMTVISMEVRKILAYRSDFWVNQVGLIIFQVILSYSLWFAIFEFNGVEKMGGYDLTNFIHYYLTAVLVAKAMLGEDIGFLSREIYDGTLNRFIVYPVSIFQYKHITYLVYSLFNNCQLFAIFLFNYFYLHPTPLSEIPWSSYLLGVFASLLSSSLFFMMGCILESIAFWADYIWSLMVLLRMTTNFLGGTLIPLTFYPEWAQEVLKFTPFPYIVTFPIKVFMNDFDSIYYLKNCAIICVWYFIFYLIFRLVWRKGQLKYTGVGI